jgi:hypothetical protein
MNRTSLENAVAAGTIEWQRHSLERMMERGISRDIVKQTLLNGEIIEDYAEDKPFPSALFLGRQEEKPLHVVAAFDERSSTCFIITAYYPDEEHFGPDFRTRR